MLIRLILLNVSSFSTRTWFGILSGYVYVSFDLILILLVVFRVPFLYILVSCTLIQSPSIGLCADSDRFCCYQARFSTFRYTHAFVDPVAHPCVFVEGECKCGYPQSAQI